MKTAYRNTQMQQVQAEPPLFIIGSISAGVIAGLAMSSKKNWFPAALGGAGAALGGVATKYGLGRDQLGDALMWGGVGLFAGSMIDHLMPRAYAQLPPALPSPTSQQTGSTSGMPYVWQPVQPSNGSYSFSQGYRYRALASLGTNYSKTDVLSYADGHGWEDILLYDVGDTLPSDWPPEGNIGNPPSGRRWMRADGVRVGTAVTMAAQPSFLLWDAPVGLNQIWVLVQTL